MLILVANITGILVMASYVYAGWHYKMAPFDWANFFGGLVLVPANVVIALSVGAWFGVILSAGFWIGSIINLTKRYWPQIKRSWRNWHTPSGSDGTR